jgi:hypothetical protein
MYETLIMIRPGEEFSLEDIERLVRDVISPGKAKVGRGTDCVFVESGDSYIWIGLNHDSYVIEESREIAREFGVDCAECASCFEMFGNDPDMGLFNYYLFINEDLEETGKFVVFDPIEGKLWGKV